jgi:hypothetical protein
VKLNSKWETAANQRNIRLEFYSVAVLRENEHLCGRRQIYQLVNNFALTAAGRLAPEVCPVHNEDLPMSECRSFKFRSQLH